MNKYFKLAGWCVAVAVGGGLSASHGEDLVNKYSDRVSIVNANNRANNGGAFWQHGITDEIRSTPNHTVVDATNTTFKNIPANISDAELVKHFASRPEWKDHKFFGSDYVFGNETTCASWQDVLTLMRDDKINSWDVGSDLQKFRTDYLNQCAWNEPKDMSYTDKEATSSYSDGEALQKGWFALLALFGTIPAIWIGFWRVVGAAVRSAKSEIKGDKK